MEPIHWITEKRKVADLIDAEYNPRKANDLEKADLSASIDEFGTVMPIVINIGSRANVIIGGHFRTSLYKEKGIEEIDVLVPSRELTLEEEMRLNLRLNKNLGSWDSKKLHSNFNLDTLLSVGFGEDDLKGLWDDVNIIDDLERAGKEPEIEEPIVPRMAIGDVFQLGNHRVMHGDSTNMEHVSSLMGDEEADMIYCDPPYNIGLDYSKGAANGPTQKEVKSYGDDATYKKDSQSDAKYEEMIGMTIKIAIASAKKDAHVFYWCDERYIWIMQKLFNEHKVANKRVCMWIKNNFTLTPQIAFNKCYEPCVYGTIGSPYLDKKYSKLNEILNANVETGNSVHDEIMDMFNIWLVRRDASAEYDHPTQKPTTLHQKPLRRCTAPGHVVLDLFGGSGSTLMACEQMDRKARLMEIDPVYCEKILRRWETFTGLKAVKI